MVSDVVMITLAIKFIEHYKLAIGISDPGLTNLLRSEFVTQDDISFRIPRKRKDGTKEFLLRRETQVTELWEDRNGLTIIDAGLIDYLVQWIQTQKKQYNFSLHLNIPKVEPIQLTERWLDVLREDQLEDITTLTNQYGGIASQHTGYGKAQMTSSPIFTPNGIKKIGDLQVGDKVSTPNGKTANVCGVYPQGNLDVYEVTFNDGAKTKCSSDHLWVTSTHYERVKGRSSVKTLKQIKETLFGYDGRSNHSIPTTKPVYFEKRHLPLDPYLLGLLLGDGCFRKHVRFSSRDEELVNAIKMRLPQNLSIKKDHGVNCNYSIVKNGGRRNFLKSILKNLGLWGHLSLTKFIPESYLFSSVKDRLKLLRGMMDTDGDCCKPTFPIFGTSSKRLAEDVKFLVESLGGLARIYEYPKTNSFRVGLSLTFNPFQLERKRNLWKPRTKYFPIRRIRTIEYVGKEECQCIKIDDEENLYLTDNFIVTHNTECLISIIDCLPGRSVVLVPNNGILREIQQRGEKYDIRIPKYDWGSRVNVICPVGFLRAKVAQEKSALDWLQGVENVFTDEAHYLQANSWVQMFEKMPNVKRAYGFSASPDVKKGHYLAPGDCTLRRMGKKGARILGMSGTTRVKRKSSANVTLVTIRTKISNKETVEGLGDSWQDIIDCMIQPMKLARMVKTVLDTFPKVKFYIPVHKVESGLVLYKNLEKLGTKGVFWSAQKVEPKRENVKEETLDYIKRIIQKKRFRFLMTTSIGFEGIDIPSLSGIIPLTGKSYRMVMQPAGRSSRGGSLVYVLIYDLDNWVVMSQTKARRSKIVKEYVIVDTMTMGDE